jgi:hypothetical protein
MVILLGAFTVAIIEVDKFLNILSLCFDDCGSLITAIDGGGIGKTLRRGDDPRSNSLTRSGPELHILSAGREGFELFNKNYQLKGLDNNSQLTHLRL